MSIIDKQRMAAVRKLVGAIVVSVIATTSAHAIETTLHCTVEGTDGVSTRQQHVTVSIEQDIWGLQEEGKAAVKSVRGVTLSPTRIFLRGGDPIVYTISLDRLSHMIRLAAQTKDGAYFKAYRGSCREVEFRSLRTR